MKTITTLFTAILIATSFNLSAQSAINPDLSFEAQSIIDEGAIQNVRYYYYPNLQAYFDTDTGTYLFQVNKEWVEANKIPAGLRGYSLLNGQRVAITDYSGDEPYEIFEQHNKQFPPNYKSKRQPPAKEESGLAYN